jgi:hypothetical protein
LAQISVPEGTCLSLFAHDAEGSLKSPVTPDLFRLSIGRLGVGFDRHFDLDLPLESPLSTSH